MVMIPSWISDNSEIPDPFGYGERAVAWLRKLRHPKSTAPGRAFVLDPWQERIVRRIYGPRDHAGNRIVRRVVLLLPRGNRKTSLAAALALLHTVGPERMAGGLTVSAAASHEQSRELFEEAASVVVGDRRLSSHLRVLDYKSAITFPKERARYIAIASNGRTQHGKTPNVVIADELHVWEGRAGQSQWEALNSALVKVPGTLLIVASTAGRGQENIAWRTVEYAMRVQRGEIDDPATLPVIFAAEKGDDWTDEAIWHAVNPGMRHGYPDLVSYRDKARKAIASPGDREEFQQYNLNLWLDRSSSPFVDMGVYDAGAAPVDLESLAGAPCWIGVDLGLTGDLSAVVAAFRDDEDHFTVVPQFFCPADNLRARADRDGVPYPTWAEQGHIIPTPGNVTDYRAIESYIRELCDRFDVQEIDFDPAYAQAIMGPLTDDGLPTAIMRQGWLTMAPAIKELERAIIGGRFTHGGHPVLRWCFDNVAVHTDSAGNRTFHKGKSRDRIDGAVACAMAVGRAASHTVASVYDDPEFNPSDMVLA